MAFSDLEERKQKFSKKTLRWRALKRRKKTENVHEALHSKMQIRTLKGTTRGKIWVDVVYICVDFTQILYLSREKAA